MDYSKMSDGEINKLIENIVRPGWQESDYRVPNSYCKNPADAWPIIVDSQISIYAMGKSDARGKWGAEAPHPYDIYSFNDNPLRAAMLVFLMMQEAK